MNPALARVRLTGHYREEARYPAAIVNVMVVPEAEMTCIDVRAMVECKRRAALAYKTQQHLIAFFDRVELLRLPQECYYERICLGKSARGMADLFGAWDEEPERIRYFQYPQAGRAESLAPAAILEEQRNHIRRCQVEMRYGPMPEKRERYKFSSPAWAEQFWNVVQKSTKDHASLLEPVDPASVPS